MKLNIINPNTSTNMTHLIATVGREMAGPETRIRCSSPDHGAASIEGYVDEALATLGVIEQILKGEAEGCDAHILACFGDPGLDAARETANGPVIGIAQAAFQAAQMLGQNFSVITTLDKAIPITHQLLQRYGATRHCNSVHAIDMPVLCLDQEPQQTADRILSLGEHILQQERVDCLVLGCAGMTAYADPLSQQLGVPVIDGLRVAIGQAEALVRAGLRTSKRLSYRPLQGKYPDTGLSTLNPEYSLPRFQQPR